ncbi:MAG: ISAs1 family transposase [Gemmatimonadota bacterium]|nr:ISAs1 family transposase [Gemmatimonadota bacterium]
MVILQASDSSIDLRAVTVRPTRGGREHRLWDRLVEEHHYLGFHGIVGKGLRHVALHGETWLALVGWQPGAFKLAARDRWIGWSQEQQFRRLHLICNNSRFVILTHGRVPNLASRVLGLSLRRLSADIQAVHGYPAFLAETFVDVSRFTGACYRASNWRSLGLTRGFARESGGAARWRHHGRPKEIFMYELAAAAAEALSRDEIPEEWNAQQHDDAAPMAAPRLRSLFECLGEVPECRKARGKRYPLRTVLTIAVAARLAGYRGVTAFAQFAALLSQEQLETVEAFHSPSRKRYTAPSITTFHNILADLPPETLDDAIGRWTAQQAGADTPLAMDGKDIRGASRQTEDGRRMMVAAVEHGTGLVLRQVEVEDKSNEIPAVRALSGSLDVTGRIVTMDAMHAQHETARSLLGRRADYVVTAVKDNQETIHDDLKAIDFTGAPWHETVDKGHGRLERRRCDAVDLTGAEWDGYAALHGRRQAIRVEREREVLKTGEHSLEVTWCLTSLDPERAGPEELLELVRNHWTIENRVHYVRDFTYDEDRCRAHVRNLPRNLSCLTNAAIAIVRCDGRFGYMPEANRHYAARAQEALDLILGPPGK